MYKDNLYINSLRGGLPVSGQGVRPRPVIHCGKHDQKLLFFPGNKVPELYFNLSKFFSRGLLSPVHAAYLPALRVIPAIFCNFADFCSFAGEVLFTPYDFL